MNIPQITSVFGEKSIMAQNFGDVTVAAFDEGPAIRLDVVRNDLSDGITWDELMDIKDRSGYGGKDAIEMYPANDAVINTGNIRHLFIFETPFELVKR